MHTANPYYFSGSWVYVGIALLLAVVLAFALASRPPRRRR
jgi:hypothetical protein